MFEKKNWVNGKKNPLKNQIRIWGPNCKIELDLPLVTLSNPFHGW